MWIGFPSRGQGRIELACDIIARGQRLHVRAGAGSTTGTAKLVVKLGARKYVAAVGFGGGGLVVMCADSEHVNMEGNDF